MINNTHKKLKNLIIILIISLSFNAFADVNKNLNNFSVTDLNGKTYNGKNLKNKFVVINFWATWCPPCVKEIPEISEFFDEHKKDVMVLGMNYEALEQSSITEFMDSFGTDYPNFSYNDNRSQFEKFSIRVLPTTFIYSPEGKLISKYEGEIDKTYLINMTNL